MTTIKEEKRKRLIKDGRIKITKHNNKKKKEAND